MLDITNDPYTSSEWAIPEGQKNATMSHLAGKLIIRFLIEKNICEIYIYKEERSLLQMM